MRLTKLKIDNFRGLSFEHDFSDDQFVIITGINGSGKSTIIEVIELLLAKQTNQIQQFWAEQITGETASFEISVDIDDDEINYLAERIYLTQPNLAEKSAIAEELQTKIFVGNKYSRKIEIPSPGPIMGWNLESSGIKEYINNTPVGFRDQSTPIGQNVFNVLLRNMVLKIDQLESVSLQFSKITAKNYVISDIFQTQNPNEQMRTSRTNFTLSSFLDSLVEYADIKTTKIEELLKEYNDILAPVIFEIRSENESFRSIALKRDATSSKTYAIGSASTGQKKAIALATLKYMWVDNVFKPIVLIDEPENSMHPGLTSRIFNSLNELAKNDPQPSFIVATHSPEVVAANPKNTYRIITDGSNSRLKKINGLEARAEILRLLGVHFHLDYVAQKIVFVESVRDKTNGEISDEEAYQRLIDPQKEQVLFISVGSSTQTENKYAFQEELFEKLKASSSDLVHRLKDRDDNEYDESCHTPFKHLEYIYVSNPDVIASSLSGVLGREITKTEIEEYLRTKDVADLLASEKYKEVWQKIRSHYTLRSKSRGAVQKEIADRFNREPELQPEQIKQLVNRYKMN